MRDLTPFLESTVNKRLLVVFPHPDDETFMAGGLIQRAKSLGYTVNVICLTKGERGQNFKKNSKLPLAKLRAQEFSTAMKILGVKQSQIWSYPDAGLKQNRSWLRELEACINKLKPGVVVSYEHSGITGHPDHIVLAVEIFIFLRSRHREIKLLWPIWPGVLRQYMVHPATKSIMPRPNVKLSLTALEKKKKLAAIKAHESQLGNWAWWQHLLLRVYRHEYFATADLAKTYRHRYVKFKVD